MASISSLVYRSAIQDAAAVANLLLTTNVTITELKEANVELGQHKGRRSEAFLLNKFL